MTDSDFIFQEGEAIQEGSAGEHDFEFSQGASITDLGSSTLVFVEGTGLGGGSFVMEGTEVGFYETAEDAASWYDYQEDPPNMKGVDEAGILEDDGVHACYVFAHRDSTTGTFAIGACYYESDENTEGKAELTWSGFADNAANPSDPILQDDPENAGDPDTYGTDGSGNPQHRNDWGAQFGDGVMYNIDPAGSFTITIQMSDVFDEDFAGEAPVEWRGRGPDGSVNKSSGYGTSFTVEVNV